MIRYFLSLILVAFAMLMSVPAWACSIFETDRENEFDYAYLSNEFIFEDDIKFTDEGALEARNQAKSDLGHRVFLADSIFLVKPVFMPVDIKAAYYDDFDLGMVKFEVTQVIKGEPREQFYLMKDGTSVALVIDPAKLMGDLKDEYEVFKRRSRERHKVHEGFEFWDNQLLVKSKMAYPPQQDSCSVPTVSQFVFGDSYLYIGSFDDPKYWDLEPVSGEKDPLVQAVIRQVEEKKWVKKSISPEEYFENMDYATPVTLSKCPAGVKRDRDINWWDPFSNFSFKKRRGKKEPAPFKPYSSITNDKLLDMVNSSWPGLFVYYPDAEKRGVTCKGNEDYLVFGYGWENEGIPQLSQNEDLWSDTKSNIRYAKIIDGEVLISSIKTQYALEGPERISLDNVFSWVPKSDFDPTIWPDLYE